jgi:hypothetical protein
MNQADIEVALFLSDPYLCRFAVCTVIRVKGFYKRAKGVFADEVGNPLGLQNI